MKMTYKKRDLSTSLFNFFKKFYGKTIMLKKAAKDSVSLFYYFLINFFKTALPSLVSIFKL